MLGTFHQSHLRIELEVPASRIRDCLLRPDQFQQWMFPQQFLVGIPEELRSGTVFTSQLGPVPVRHQVEAISTNYLQLLLSEGIDGFHHWYWGDGWVQSSLEGISLLPLNLAHSFSLLRLKQFITSTK